MPGAWYVSTLKGIYNFKSSIVEELTSVAIQVMTRRAKARDSKKM
jgi:hypothetical protein